MARALALSLAVCALLLALVWAEPRPIDDLFIALAGGRDVLAGRLGTPDDWSFATEGRVWLNQNWGSHVIFYAAHAAAGTTGLLLLKALLLVACTTFLAFAARARGVAWPEAVLAAAIAFAVSRSYVDLRPNLVGLTLACALLCVLTRAATRPVWLWLAVLIVWVWANAHGSFLFGLGLLALFALTVGAMKPRMLPAALAASATAGALAAFVNPFGLENLTHALVVGGSPAWRDVSEWAPLFTTDVTDFGSRWEICALAVVFALLLLARAAIGRGTNEPADADSAAARGRALFDAVAILVVTVMAVRARRFVPLAAVVLAVPLAMQLDWWRRRLASDWPTRVVAIGLAVAVAVAAPPVLRRYHAANPVFAGYDTFGRMVDAPTFPNDAAEFLRANGIGGRAYTAWEWEGFLRWTETPVTVLIGGRAQQAYDEPILLLNKDIRSGGIAPRDALKPLRVGLAILPLTGPYSNPLNRLVYADGSTWAYLYNDGRHAVLIDTASSELAPAVAALEAGTLRYPSPAVAATSRMMYLASPRAGAELDAIRKAAEEAARTAPTALAYAVLGDVALSDRSLGSAIRTYLAAERERLAALAADHEDFALAQARVAEARIEAALIGRIVDPEGVKRSKAELEARRADLRAMLTRWAYDWDPNVY